MKLTPQRVIPVIALMALFATGTFYAQQHVDHSAKQTPAKSDVPEIFCSLMGTGQLCSGNAKMFNLSEAQKQRYAEALDSYNKAVGAAAKQFVADAKDKVRMSPTELALVESWFAQGLNPEINKILAAKAKSK